MKTRSIRIGLLILLCGAASLYLVACGGGGGGGGGDDGNRWNEMVWNSGTWGP